MARYEIVLRKSVLRDLDRIPKPDVKRILTAIRALADHPRPSQSLRLTAEAKYRLRCEVHRVLYSIEDDRLVVTVVKVRCREDAYRP
jgi:mRNA interferase RelE/StbE